jgi:hypothetical protein
VVLLNNFLVTVVAVAVAAHKKEVAVVAAVN